MTVRVGVVGVGSMGRHHARVLSELTGAELVGIADADHDRAREVADQYDTRALSTGALLAASEAVTVAVPTKYHAEVVGRAFEENVHVLVEKPFVEDLETGRDLVRRAEDADLVLQVGHVERFNPAVRTLDDVLVDAEILAVDARRLGPPVDGDREVGDNVVLDLMIHDVDVLLSLLDGDVRHVSGARTDGEPYATATLTFSDGVVGTMTASRITQQKVRKLAVTTRECLVDVDYLTQSVEIHRRSLPEFVDDGRDVRYRYENVVERPTVGNGEPLKHELESFVEAVEHGEDPPVTGADGLRALKLAREIDDASRRTSSRPEVRVR